jgi:hypothetical protein
VVDLDTRAPVPGVEVTVGNLSDRTGADGRFQIADPDPGTSTLRMERPYYITASRLVEVPAEGFVDLELELAASGRVSGTVHTSGGSPIGGAIVEAGDATASTNSLGECLLVHLRPGRYEVRASANGYAQQSTVVDVERGTTVAANLALPQAGQVEGRVVEQGTATGIANAVIAVGGRVGISGSDGQYVVAGVPSGSQMLRVTAVHFQEASTTVTVPAGDAVNQEVELTPVPRVEVTGQVTATNGTPVSGAFVRFGPNWNFTRSTDAEGYYTVPSSGDLVPTDISLVTVSATGFPTTEREIDLTGVGSPVTVNIVLDDFARVTGRLVDRSTGEGIGGEQVYCGGFATTVSGGAFAIPNVTPRAYNCYVFGSDCYPYQPQAIEPLESGEHREVTLLASRRANVHVTVRNASDGSPIATADVWTSVPSRTIHGLSSADGTTTIPCVDAGEQVLYGWRPGYSSGAARVLVPDSGQVQAWIDLEPAP